MKILGIIRKYKIICIFGCRYDTWKSVEVVILKGSWDIFRGMKAKSIFWTAL